MLIEAYIFHDLVKEMTEYRQGRSTTEPRYGTHSYTSGFVAMRDRNGQLCIGASAEGSTVAYRGPGADDLNQSLRAVGIDEGQQLAVLFDDGKGARAGRPVCYCALYQEIGKAITSKLDYNCFDEVVAVVPAGEQWAAVQEWF